MMIKQLRGKEIEIETGKITELGIMDQQLSEDIYRAITRYFGGHKYSEDDLLLYGQELPVITEGYLDVPKTKYKCIGIASAGDLDEVLLCKKGTPLFEYNKFLMGKLDVVREMEELERQYNIIIQKVRAGYPQETKIQVDEMTINADIILAKNLNVYISDSLTVYDKILQLMMMLEFVSEQECKEVIIYLHGVEALLSVQELNHLREWVNKSSYIKLFVSTSKSEYLELNSLNQINFLYRGKVCKLPNVEMLLRKVNRLIIGNDEIDIYTLNDYLSRNVFQLLNESNGLKSTDFKIEEALKCEENVERVLQEIRLENCIII